MSTLLGPRIETRDARKRYASSRATVGRGALAGVTVSAGPGVTVIAGPNGAGKTTLLSLCLGFLRPNAGSVTVDGRAPGAWLRCNGAAYVPERFAPPAGWTPASALPALARLAGARDPRAAARAAIARFGLEGLEGSRAGLLSRGELQRFALAQAALTACSLVVLDEPEQGLDGRGRAALVDWVEERRAAGASVLLATHDAALGARLADAVVVLSGGAVDALLEAGEAARVPSAYTVELEAAHDALGRWAGAPGPLRTARVPVAGHDDLQARLRALIDAGARPVRLAPATTALEDRIRVALAAADRPRQAERSPR